MDHGSSMALEHARKLATALVEQLEPACQRIEIAGSIRRQKPNPNDIELVAVPSYDPGLRMQSMWDSQVESSVPTNLLDERCNDLLRAGTLEKRPDRRSRHCWGTGIKRAVFYQGQDYAPVDLFQVIEPRQWGVIFAIRTGPGDFNRLLVTNRRWGGACPLDRKVAGGRVWSIDPGREDLARMAASRFAKLAERGEIDASLLPTPTEQDFFRQLGVPCWPPEQRTIHQLREYLQQTRR
ncbi:MAG: hypothetical protein GWN58_26370 [Anaerolineae bacterium]|nr:hypothetical protein [Anaerolineae bacterium]